MDAELSVKCQAKHLSASSCSHSKRLYFVLRGERAGGQPGRNWTQILCGDGPSSGHTGAAGGRAVSAAFGHAAQQNRLRAAAAHQAEPGDGDRNLQEAAGRRGNVKKAWMLIYFYFFLNTDLNNFCYFKLKELFHNLKNTA